MTDEIRIWALDGSSDNAEPVSPTDRVEREDYLEIVLVKNPHMLMPGLTLVGRQMPTDSGPLDLLGIDREGRLVVFELKRGKLTRDAIAQAIDYCSYLESLPETELVTYIEDHSGKSGIDKISDFASWYDERQGGKELTSLRPTAIVLVGLGIDERAQRMSRLQNSDRFGAAQEHPNWQRRPRTAIGAILMATMVGSALAQPPIRYFRRTSGGFGRTVFREVRPP